MPNIYIHGLTLGEEIRETRQNIADLMKKASYEEHVVITSTKSICTLAKSGLADPYLEIRATSEVLSAHLRDMITRLEPLRKKFGIEVVVLNIYFPHKT